MKNLMMAIVLVMMTGCAAQRTVYTDPMAEVLPSARVSDKLADKEATVGSSVDISMDLSASYCGQDGFIKFSESKRYYLFTCKDGSKFKISTGR